MHYDLDHRDRAPVRNLTDKDLRVLYDLAQNPCPEQPEHEQFAADPYADGSNLL